MRIWKTWLVFVLLSYGSGLLWGCGGDSKRGSGLGKGADASRSETETLEHNPTAAQPKKVMNGLNRQDEATMGRLSVPTDHEGTASKKEVKESLGAEEEESVDDDETSNEFDMEESTGVGGNKDDSKNSPAEDVNPKKTSVAERVQETPQQVGERLQGGLVRQRAEVLRLEGIVHRTRLEPDRPRPEDIAAYVVLGDELAEGAANLRLEAQRFRGEAMDLGLGIADQFSTIIRVANQILLEPERVRLVAERLRVELQENIDNFQQEAVRLQGELARLQEEAARVRGLVDGIGIDGAGGLVTAIGDLNIAAGNLGANASVFCLDAQFRRFETEAGVFANIVDQAALLGAEAQRLNEVLVQRLPVLGDEAVAARIRAPVQAVAVRLRAEADRITRDIAALNDVLVNEANRTENYALALTLSWDATILRGNAAALERDAERGQLTDLVAEAVRLQEDAQRMLLQAGRAKTRFGADVEIRALRAKAERLVGLSEELTRNPDERKAVNVQEQADTLREEAEHFRLRALICGGLDALVAEAARIGTRATGIRDYAQRIQLTF